MKRTPLYLITGFLGSGKTTFLKEIISQIKTSDLKDKKIGIIENEFGEVGIDGKLLEDEDIELSEIKRIHEIIADPGICFLAQNVICMGPATRDGCDYPCVRGNMPCTGCMGPVSGADQGAKMIGTLGGILSGQSDGTVDKVLEGIVDPAGTFYRYGIAASLLGRSRDREEEE